MVGESIFWRLDIPGDCELAGAFRKRRYCAIGRACEGLVSPRTFAQREDSDDGQRAVANNPITFSRGSRP